MKQTTILFLCATLLLMGCTHSADSSRQMDRFINHLMAQMTIDDELGQLHMPTADDVTTGQDSSRNIPSLLRKGQVGAILNLKGASSIAAMQRIAVEESRLGIPVLFCMDVIHGYETIYPIPLTLSYSWDMQGIQHAAEIAACEASADGICLTFSPMVDICHDARWGRIAEGSGEDPYLGACIARAMVRGYQGQDLTDDHTIMACMKHFALYGAPIAGREYNAADMSRYYMFNEYMEPYKACVDAGVGSVMASFNTVNGIPATCNKWLLTDLLRQQWGFDGLVMSDYTAVKELQCHGVGDTPEDVSILALQAGLDLDMVSAGLPNLGDAYQAGKVSKRDIDRACRRVLEAKYRLGLFADPYRYCDTTRRAQEILCPAHRAHAREMARKSMVLLKNDNALLPLPKQATIALIGPLADTRANMMGTWAVTGVPEQYKTLKEGLEQAVAGQGHLLYAKGCNLMYDTQAEAIGTMFGRQMRDARTPEQMRAEALHMARQADVIVLAMGEASEMSGECSSRVDIATPSAQHDLMVELKKIGKPMVLLHFAGRPTVLNWEAEHLDAILEVGFCGSETADAVADLLWGDYSPSGRLTVSMPRHVGQCPIAYRQYNTGRPLHPGEDFHKYLSCYADVVNTPLFPFGYGMSYTSFAYSPLTLSCHAMSADATADAAITVTNTGTMEADEVVQLYIQDIVSLPVRPTKELRGFQRIHLAPGESRQVHFTIGSQQLGFYNNECQWVVEPGEFIIMIGHDSDTYSAATVTVQ